MTTRVAKKEEYGRNIKYHGREPQGAWGQDELIGGKQPVVK
jgi:hypothetical protein